MRRCEVCGSDTWGLLCDRCYQPQESKATALALIRTSSTGVNSKWANFKGRDATYSRALGGQADDVSDDYDDEYRPRDAWCHLGAERTEQFGRFGSKHFTDDP